MSNRVTEFENLLKEMGRALVNNEVKRISELTVLQQQCLSSIVQEAQKDAGLKEYIRIRMPEIVQQIKFNEILLKQAIDLTNHMVINLYARMKSKSLTSNPRSYTA